MGATFIFLTRSGNDSLTVNRATAAYEDAACGDYVQMMHDHANDIGDADLRAKAVALADLDATIVELWSDTVAGPPAPGAEESQTLASERKFMQAYREYHDSHSRTVDELLTASPGMS
ncbi:hypothetical protein ABQE48_00650 [Mycolicibacterium thermoresistibile]